MQVNQAQTMCITNTDAESCEEQCEVGDMNTLFASTDNGALESSRFCMMDCVPTSNKVGESCYELTQRMTSKLLSSDGNGKDPATLLQPEPQRLPRELLSEKKLLFPSDRAADLDALRTTDPEALARMLGNLRGGRSAADFKAVLDLAEAAGKRAFAAALDARTARVETGSAISLVNSTSDFRKATFNSEMANDADTKLKAAEVRAKVYARSAAEAYERALKDVEEMKEAPAIIAQEVATFAVNKLKRQAAMLLSAGKAQEAELATTEPPLTEAAALAMAPYQAAEQRAVTARSMYETQAHQLSEQAEGLQKDARRLRSEAFKYNENGQREVAQQMVAQAQGMLDRATQVDAQAQSDYAQAQGLSHGSRAYGEYASMAGARATALSRQWWMPPAVPQPPGAPGPAPAPAPPPGTALLARGRRVRGAILAEG